MNTEKENGQFENNLKEVMAIMEKLERGEIAQFEEQIAAYEEAKSIIDKCKDWLQKAQLRLVQLEG